MSCCGDPLHAKFVLTFFVSSQTDDIFQLSIYPAAPGNFAHTGKVALPSFVKGVGFEKGRGSLLPFSVFLVPFVTVQKEHAFLFPLEKE